MFANLLKIADNIVTAGNINSISNIIQNKLLKDRNYFDLSDQQKADLNQSISQTKKKIDDNIKQQTSNKQYISWIYDILKKQDQGIQDIPKLINDLNKLDKIKKYRDKIEKIDKNALDVFTYNTYGKLHDFVSQKISQIQDSSLLRQKNKSIDLPFKKFASAGSYSLYKITVLDQEVFKTVYGENGYDTGWCVAQDTVSFDYYMGEYDCYYLITKDKNTPIALISLDDCQFRDIHDSVFKKINKQISQLMMQLLKYYGIPYEKLNKDMYGISLLLKFETTFLQRDLYERDQFKKISKHLYQDQERNLYWVDKKLLFVFSCSAGQFEFLNTTITQQMFEQIAQYNKNHYNYNTIFYCSQFEGLDGNTVFEWYKNFTNTDDFDKLYTLATRTNVSEDNIKIVIDYLFEHDLMMKLRRIYQSTNNINIKKYIDSKAFILEAHQDIIINEQTIDQMYQKRVVSYSEDREKLVQKLIKVYNDFDNEYQQKIFKIFEKNAVPTIIPFYDIIFKQKKYQRFAHWYIERNTLQATKISNMNKDNQNFVIDTLIKRGLTKNILIVISEYFDEQQCDKVLNVVSDELLLQFMSKLVKGQYNLFIEKCLMQFNRQEIEKIYIRYISQTQDMPNDKLLNAIFATNFNSKDQMLIQMLDRNASISRFNDVEFHQKVIDYLIRNNKLDVLSKVYLDGSFLTSKIKKEVCLTLLENNFKVYDLGIADKALKWFPNDNQIVDVVYNIAISDKIFIGSATTIITHKLVDNDKLSKLEQFYKDEYDKYRLSSRIYKIAKMILSAEFYFPELIVDKSRNLGNNNVDIKGYSFYSNQGLSFAKTGGQYEGIPDGRLFNTKIISIPINNLRNLDKAVFNQLGVFFSNNLFLQSAHKALGITPNHSMNFSNAKKAVLKNPEDTMIKENTELKNNKIVTKQVLEDIKKATIQIMRGTKKTISEYASEISQKFKQKQSETLQFELSEQQMMKLIEMCEVQYDQNGTYDIVKKEGIQFLKSLTNNQKLNCDEKYYITFFDNKIELKNKRD